MRKLQLHFLVLIIQFGIINNTIAKEVIISGLSKDKSSEVILKNYFISYKTKTNTSGLFSFKIILNSPQYFQLKTDKTINIFLIPGDSIFINQENMVSLNSNSESALISDYLINWYVYTDSLFANFNRITYYSQAPQSFVSIVMNDYDAIKVPLDNFLTHYPTTNKEFVRLENERLKSWMWCPFNRYEYRYKAYTGEKVQVSGNYYDYLKKIDFNDSSLLQLSDFNDFIRTYIDMKVFKASEQNQESFVDPYFKTKVLLNTIKESITNQRMLDDILKKQMEKQIYNMDLNDSLFSIVENTIKNPKYVNDLKNYYNSMQIFQKGNSAPDFKLMDMQDSIYTLKNFKGKYLLIDVWGIYCGPCIKEILNLKELKAEFKDANITFIQVNIDGTKDAWIKKVKDLNLDGLQLMANNGWKSEFQKAYKINRVPTFILIDHEGKFIDARTKRPSENLRYVLNNLPDIKDK